jgi:hypothetical protein
MLRDLPQEFMRAYQAAPAYGPDDLPTVSLDKVIDPQGRSNIIRLRDSAQLEHAYRFAMREFDSGLEEADIGHCVSHEVQHADAGDQLGLVRSGLSMALGKLILDGRERLLTQAFYVIDDNEFARLSLLQLMAIIAYPAVPSKSDIQELHDNGYDVERVGYEASRNNEFCSDMFIPLPLSYRPNGSRIFVPVPSPK